ncbi:MAG: hypothetical protein ACKON9_26210, partial [Planctomycetaceae bacterium]
RQPEDNSQFRSPRGAESHGQASPAAGLLPGGHPVFPHPDGSQQKVGLVTIPLWFSRALHWSPNCLADIR